MHNPTQTQNITTQLTREAMPNPKTRAMYVTFKKLKQASGELNILDKTMYTTPGGNSGARIFEFVR